VFKVITNVIIVRVITVISGNTITGFNFICKSMYRPYVTESCATHNFHMNLNIGCEKPVMYTVRYLQLQMVKKYVLRFFGLKSFLF